MAKVLSLFGSRSYSCNKS